MSNSIKKALKKIKKSKKNVSLWKDKLVEAYRESIFECKNCKESSALHEVILIQTYWYERPISCMDGDIWHHDEKNLLCPKCGMRHRLLSEESQKKFTDLECGTSNVYDHKLDRYNENFYTLDDPHDAIRELNGIKLLGCKFINL